MVWVFIRYYTSCDALNCSFVGDLTFNIESSLQTYDFLLTTVISITFFIREGFRYDEGSGDDITINLWKYIAYTFLFSVPTALAFFIATLLFTEECSLQHFIEENKVTLKSSKGKKLEEFQTDFLQAFGVVNPFFFIIYFVLLIVSLFTWVPAYEIIFTNLVQGDISQHYLNLSMQFITRANFLLWMEVPLLIASVATSRGISMNTFIFAAVMIASSFSISTVLASVLLYMEWTYSDYRKVKKLLNPLNRPYRNMNQTDG